MYRELFRLSSSGGVRFWFAAMERALVRSLAKVSFRCTPIGPVADYCGGATLYLFDRDVLLQRLEKENTVLGAWFNDNPSVLLSPTRCTDYSGKSLTFLSKPHTDHQPGIVTRRTTAPDSLTD